ncbi:MAG: Ig-like domain-containing protein, partial [Planctomycetota bacterium]|nr:Ig-like domain-containing protein [Planctomycetota bacterium]
PLPVDGATGVPIDQDLSWTAASGAASYDVYLGTDPALGLFSGDFLGNQTGVTRDVGTLLYSTTYYWRVDALNSGGTTLGTVWSFTTEGPPPPTETLLFLDGFGQGSLGPGWSSPDLRKIRIRGGNPIDGFFARIRRAQYMEVTVDASAYTGLRLESSRRARNYDAGESFQVIVNGTAVETMTGSTGWITSDIDLTTFAGQSTVTVRFKSNGSRLNESGDIDQIRIIGLN